MWATWSTELPEGPRTLRGAKGPADQAGVETEVRWEMRKALLVLFVLLAFWTPLAAADLTGLWSLDLLPDFGGQDDQLGCSFVQDGEKLTANSGGARDMFGEVKGQKVTLRLVTGRQGELTATFTGDLDQAETTVTGTWQLPDGQSTREGKFLAKKISGK